MSVNNPKSVLILGGAGFIGSNIALRAVKKGMRVTVIDGLLPQSNGSALNLKPVQNQIRWIRSRVERVPQLSRLIREHDILIDAMGLTSHMLARTNPLYDLELNTASHLHVMEKLKDIPGKTVVYLGTRVQYGSVAKAPIREEAPMVPDDAQGVNKLTAELHFRIGTRLYGYHVISLRVPNCFGPHLPVRGPDLGLVGNFIRDFSRGKTVPVFKGNRTRELLYVDVLAEAALKLAGKSLKGFHAFNIGGDIVSISDLASQIRDSVGKGRLVWKPVPHHLKMTDMGNAALSTTKLKRIVGPLSRPPLKRALAITVADSLRRARD